MAQDRRQPDWVAKRARGNRIIGLALFGLVLVYLVLFVVQYVFK